MEKISSSDFQGLFREFPRLPKKLSSQEIRGINEFIQRKVQHEYAYLIKRMSDFQMSRDYLDRNYSRTVELLQKETERDKRLAHEYRSRFGNIAQVLSNKEERFEGKYDTLVKQAEDLEENYESLSRDKLLLEEENEKKDSVIGNLHEEIATLNERMAERANYDNLLQESEKYRRDILRVKLDLDLQKRENTELLRDIDRMKEALKAGVYPDPALVKPYLYNVSAELKPISNNEVDTDALGTSVTAVVPRASSLTRMTNNPGLSCTIGTCRARRDLEDCKAELARKCHENAYLSYLVAQARAKDPDSTSMKKLGLDYYEGRAILPDTKAYNKRGTSNVLYRSAPTYRKSERINVSQTPQLRNRALYKA